MKIFFQSLGCPKNQVDSEVMLHSLLVHGKHEIVDEPAGADAAVINTCCFIAEATEETLNAVTELIEYKRRGLLGAVIVTGCLVNRYEGTLGELLPEVDFFGGTATGCGILGIVEKIVARNEAAKSGKAPVDEKPRKQTGGSRAAEAVQTSGRVITGFPATAYLKVSEGCHRKCSYCIIPAIRGPLRSKSPEDVVSEAVGLIGQGARELVLIAEDTTSYGLDLGVQNGLASVLTRLIDLPGLDWIRLLYAYPEGLTPRIIREIAGCHKIVPYLDIPFQHASEKVLKAMGRPGGSSINKELVASLRESIPGLVLRTTFIVGFPGESAKDFETLLEFMTATRIERIGAFKYSREDGTPAARMAGQTRPSTRERRFSELMELAATISMESNEKLIGQRMDILIDGHSESGMLAGRYYGQAPSIDGVVLVDETHAGQAPAPGSFATVEITGADIYDLTASLHES